MKSVRQALCSAKKLQYEPKSGLVEDCQADAYPAERVLYQPKEHEINLDLAPEERWVKVGKEYSSQMKNTLKIIIDLINKLDDKVVPYLEQVSIIRFVSLKKFS